MIVNGLAILNIVLVLGLVSFFPCLMAGLMSMDSPQAQNDPVAHLAMYIMLSFPLVCWICAILSYYFRSWIFGLFPMFEAVLFVTILWILSPK
jgi:hypothetical protein